MYNLIKFILVLVSISQETVLNWFGIEDPTYRDMNPDQLRDYGIDISNIPTSSDVSLETFRILAEGLWDKFQSGLGLSDIEDIIFFIAFIRFIILAIRYNIKTSFYITCIGLFAAYLWYRHLIDLTMAYRHAFLATRFIQRLGMDSLNLSLINKGLRTKIGYREGLSNPIGVLRYALVQGSTQGVFRIDPISMLFANVPEQFKSTTDSIYYFIYRDAVPWFYKFCQREASIMTGLVAYVYITRMGKKYCPYLVRWHWTFLMLLDFVERPFYDLSYRISYYLNEVLIPMTEERFYLYNSSLNNEIEFVKAILTVIVLSHITFVIFGLLHALCGQYFYFPFLTENTELHIGSRPTNSIYSGGYTAWQDSEEKNKLRLIPKLWYGWFGRGTKNQWLTLKKIKKFFKKFGKLFKR